jgi:hypothetical protein
VDHLSFWLDVKIILQTVGKIFKREGISSESSATMEEFMGSPEQISMNGDRNDRSKLSERKGRIT